MVKPEDAVFAMQTSVRIGKAATFLCQMEENIEKALKTMDDLEREYPGNGNIMLMKDLFFQAKLLSITHKTIMRIGKEALTQTNPLVQIGPETIQ